MKNKAKIDPKRFEILKAYQKGERKLCKMLDSSQWECLKFCVCPKFIT